MTAPALIEPRGQSRTSGIHARRHRTRSPGGGRCGYPSERPGGVCGRAPVAAYVNERGPGIAWRCATHDRAVVVEAAARMGFVRQAVRS